VRHLGDGQGRLELRTLESLLRSEDQIKAYKLVNEVTTTWRELQFLAISSLSLLLHGPLQHTAEALEENAIYALKPTNFHVTLPDIDIESQRDLSRFLGFHSFGF
jgi:hypothetical protein